MQSKMEKRDFLQQQSKIGNKLAPKIKMFVQYA